MKLSDLPTDELQRILRATEEAAGVESVEAKIFRRELAKRDKESATTTDDSEVNK